MAEHYNVAIIGGGIHGTGVAQAAACAGYSVLLIEKTRLAAGSSSRSSKLIHGGLRYLEGLDFSLVSEGLAERQLLLKIAPELVQLQPFHIPVYPQTSRRPLTIRAGLSLYAILGRLHRDNRFRKLGRRDWDRLDGLQTRDLQAVYRYYDAQTNDIELTRAVMQSAIGLGAELRCPAEFLEARITDSGCRIHYRNAGGENACTADVMINAAGPWVHLVDRNITPAPEHIPLDLVQGVDPQLRPSLVQLHDIPPEPFEAGFLNGHLGDHRIGQNLFDTLRRLFGFLPRPQHLLRYGEHIVLITLNQLLES